MTFFCHVLAVRFSNMLFEHRNSNQFLESDSSDLGFFLKNLLCFIIVLPFELRSVVLSPSKYLLLLEGLFWSFPLAYHCPKFHSVITTGKKSGISPAIWKRFAILCPMVKGMLGGTSVGAYEMRGPGQGLHLPRL